MNKYLMEMIGTFFLVLTVGCSITAPGMSVSVPLAMGSALMVMTFAGRHVSGGHYNPAVTLGVWLRGRCETKDVLPYWIAQTVGAALAAGSTLYLRSGFHFEPMDVAIGPALLAEFLFTFALVFVVLNVATSKGTEGNSFYGLAIGFTVMIGAFAVGDISVGAFNPAVATGLTLMGLSSWSNIWIYYVAEFFGGFVAAMAFKAINPADK